MKEEALGMGELFARVIAVNPDQYIEPDKGKGIFEVTGFLMNDFEKKLYTVFRQLVDESNQIRQRLSSNKIPSREVGKAEAELNVLKDKMNSVKGLMYFSISDRLHMWACSIGVSKGWKIIIPDEEAEKEEKEEMIVVELPQEFRRLFEMLGTMGHSFKNGEESEADNSELLSGMARNMMRDARR